MNEATLALHLMVNFPPLRFELTADSLNMVIQKIRKYRDAWATHPQFEHWQKFKELAFLPFASPVFAFAVMVFTHEPGLDKRTETYLVTSLDDFPDAYRWATKTRTFGKFSRVMPIQNDLHGDPHYPVVFNYCYGGKAIAYHARMELKRLLPTSLHRYIQDARRINRQAKNRFLGTPPEKIQKFWMPPTDMRELNELQDDRKHHPDWFKTRSKGELWVMSLPDQVRGQMRYYMGAEINFWNAATGQVNPNNVESLFIKLPKRAVVIPQQMELL